MKKNGFTLIELMILVAIAGIILAIAIPVITGKSHLTTNRMYNQPVTNNALQCVNGFVILPNGGQLIDENGHGVRCQ